MKKWKVQELDHGLYKVWWKSGGASLAAVGSNFAGERWIAPTNWISVHDSKFYGAWRDVKKVKRLY